MDCDWYFPKSQDLAAWINANEHGSAFAIVGTPGDPNDTARRRLNEFIHFTYFRNSPSADRVITFLAAWSVALFQQRSPSGVIVDDRTYDFFKKVLIRTEDLFPNSGLFIFSDSLNWNVNAILDTSSYSLETQNQLAAGATFTFGSTEVDNLDNPALFRDPARQGVLWYEFLSNSTNSGGVYFLTQDQFNCAQAARRGEKTVQECIDDLS